MKEVFSQAYASVEMLHSLPTQFTIKTPIDISAELRKQPFYKNIQSKIRANRQRAWKKHHTATLGATHTFNARNILSLSNWDSVTAVCKYASNNIALWMSEDAVSTLEADHNIEDILAELTATIEHESNPFSENPSIGIYNRNLKYFGNPPDVDGDGILDILLYDIQDNFESTGSFVAGFFDPVDLIDHPNSNQRDILYIDIYPTMVYQDTLTYSRVLATIAHEFQHLIHANYEGDEPQSVFINEGLSEFAEVLSGYSTRSFTDYFNHSNRPLLSWNYGDPIPDYSRASLFFTYLFEQVGYEKTKELVSTQKVGLEALQELIYNSLGIDVDDLFSDWGYALMLNDVNYNAKYGYKHPFFKELDTAANTAQLPYGSNESVLPYSNKLVQFPLVRELQVELENKHREVKGIGILPTGEHLVFDHNTRWFDVSEHQHASVLLNLSQLNTNLESSVHITGRNQSTFKQLSYDDGIPDAFIGNASYLLLDDTDINIALIFPIQSPSWVSQFSVKTVFKSELAGSVISSNAPRDMEYQVYSVKHGVPHTPITPKLRHRFTRPFGNLRFERIPLNAWYSQLSTISDSVAIVLSNDADDANFFAIGLEHAKQPLASYTNNEEWHNFDDNLINGVDITGWTPFIRLGTVVEKLNHTLPQNDLWAELTNENIVLNVETDQPIDSSTSWVLARLPSGHVYTSRLQEDENTPSYRARFPIQVDGVYQFNVQLTSKDGLHTFQGELAWRIPETADFTLGHNYPNPFNPSTTIPFLLVEKGDVTVSVYDLLGRKVLTKPSQAFTAGKHTISLNFSGLASGVYVIRMNVERPNGRGAVTRTLKVMLLK
jgi:hypothetical protein